MPFVGPEPFCGVATCHLKMEIRNWENQVKIQYWNNTPRQRQAKLFIEYSPKRAKEMLYLSKEELQILTGLLTGHCSLNYHLHNMGIAESPTCRLCNEAPETADHILCECGPASHKRLKYFSRMIITPKEVMKTSPKKIVAFFKSLNLP
uniref:Reverse transcriptase zinc-binding domain-containing protein n=1 Tax=Cacopsylla melanoneura TaxID=428564 RepID=A0A8D8XN64_9HEMI